MKTIITEKPNHIYVMKRETVHASYEMTFYSARDLKEYIKDAGIKNAEWKKEMK